MNILPKKSWHVRNRDNIERVRRDEENARKEEEEKLRRVALAEQEARTDALRQKARQKGISEKPTSTATLRHIDFFSDYESKKGNKEHEEEKKAEKEKDEKNIGLLTYLGQTAIDAQKDKPWYLKSKSDTEKDTNEDLIHRKKKLEFDKRSKASQDPLRDMMRYMGEKKSSSKKKYDDLPNVLSTKSAPKPPKEKQPSSTKTVEQLRAERLEREKAERAKTEKLLAKMRGEKVVERPPTPERERKYNSQFNPDCVRRPKNKHRYQPY